MTEQEAVEGMLFLKEKLYNGIFKDRLECLDEAIKTLEEIQQYRALGTPTKIYEKIGGLDVELDMYHSLGTVEELRVARDKQVAKKPPFIKRSFTQFYVCPGCSNAEHYEKLYSKMPYCFKCGQKLDWSDEDDLRSI